MKLYGMETIGLPDNVRVSSEVRPKSVFGVIAVMAFEDKSLNKPFDQCRHIDGRVKQFLKIAKGGKGEIGDRSQLIRRKRPN